MQALLASARASLLMRRAEGGFPIKLVNSLAVGTPAIAFHGPEWGLEHEHNSLICSPEHPVPSMTAAIDRLASQNDLRARLAAGARDLYLERHRPEPAGKQTLALVEEACRRHSSR
jgi:glycosyltransferase involved in cell wall biosynthesis